MYTLRNLIILIAIACLTWSCDATKKSNQGSTSTSEQKGTSPAKNPNDKIKGTGNKTGSTTDKDDEVKSANALELKMIEEINLVRSNPKGYTRYIDEYLSYFEKGKFPSLGIEKRTAEELRAQLNNMAPVSTLKYNEALYKVAEKHGKYLKERGDIFTQNPHTGKNGSTTEARIKKGTDLKIFGENFGSAHDSPRYQLLSLLIDAGVAGRAHRVNILDPRWNVVACYSIGAVGPDPGCWLQLFGYEEVGNSKNETPGEKVTLAEVNKLVSRATYMKPDERNMLNEINLLRSNPKGYVQYIEAYKKQVQNGEIWPMVPVGEEIENANGLIKELKKLKPLSLLKPDLKLYNVATQHGQYLKRKGNPGMNGNPHLGSNGKGAHERIVAGANMSKGGENYQSSYTDARSTLIGLLVDSGIPGFGHRKTMLNPAWDYGVCHDFGPASIGGTSVPHLWLQNFGKR